MERVVSYDGCVCMMTKIELEEEERGEEGEEEEEEENDSTFANVLVAVSIEPKNCFYFQMHTRASHTLNSTRLAVLFKYHAIHP